MSDPLTQEQYQSTVALDADQRYDHFIQQVVAQGELWILKDEQGCMLLTADGDDCIPVWSHPDYAKAWAAEEWANCEPYAVTLKAWLDRWVKGMEEDGLAVAVFPLPEAIGVIEDPAEVADNLLRQMSKQNRKKK